MHVREDGDGGQGDERTDPRPRTERRSVGTSSLKTAKLIQNATLKVYPGLPHGMCATNPELINPDLLAFFKG